MAKVRDFFRCRIVQPLRAQLTQGATPERLALSCAVGATIGAFPIIGSTTLLCAIVGWGLKLNQPALQAVNYLIYPVQIALLPLFISAGQRVTSSEPIALRPDLIVSEFFSDTRLFLSHYGWVGLHAIMIWAICAPFAALAIYQACRAIFKRWSRESQRTSP